eukprot:scaffold443860_cov13-Prasinocladus_malaysianus.AAC.1
MSAATITAVLLSLRLHCTSTATESTARTPRQLSLSQHAAAISAGLRVQRLPYGHAADNHSTLYDHNE